MTSPNHTEIARALAKALHDAIEAQLPGPVGTGPGATTVMFAAAGRPVNPAEFTQSNPVVNRQATSLFVDCRPMPGTTFVPASSRFSEIYESLATSARPAGGIIGDLLTGVSGRIAKAKRLVENNKVGMIGAPVTYLPTDQQPAGWWDTAGQHWTSLQTTDMPDPTKPAEPPPIPPPSWDWSVAAAAKRGESPPIIYKGPEVYLASRPEQAELVGAAPQLRQVELSAGLTIGTRLARQQNVVSEVPTTVVIRPDAVDDMTATSEPTAATSTDFEVRFDYCYVSLQRGWIDDFWLQGGGWEVPGYSIGAIAAGNPIVNGQLLPVIPLGFVAVKNVTITANWTAHDVELLPKSVALGPFLLPGATFSDQSAALTGGTAPATLTIPGVQVIAWICQIPPKLPPAG